MHRKYNRDEIYPYLIRNYSGTKRSCHSVGIFFHFEHCASAKKDSSRMTCERMAE
jgi:hypothetical protein